jgi:hypothetical protein
MSPGEGVEWQSVVETASRLRDLLGNTRLNSWPKTTGGKGLHIMVPIEAKLAWNAALDYTREIAERVGGYCSRKIHDFSGVLCKLCEYRSDRRVFMGPVEPGAGQQPDRAPVQPGMHRRLPRAIAFRSALSPASIRRSFETASIASSFKASWPGGNGAPLVNAASS